MSKQAGTLMEDNTNKTNLLLLIGVILVGSNLRVPITSVGALITFIREDLGISNATAGMITTLPFIAFAKLSPFAPKISKRIGMLRTIALSLVVLLIEIILRSIKGISLLFVGVSLIGLASETGNVLIPGILKMKSPLNIGLITGISSVFLIKSGALALGVSVTLSSIGNLRCRGVLAIWVVLTVIALLIWLPQL